MNYTFLSHSKFSMHAPPTRSVWLISLRLILLALVMLINLAAEGHNGAVAYAYPISGITVDGDLSDWPAHYHRYDINELGVGDRAKNEQDLSAQFRVAYHTALQKIFIAVEVVDESLMLDTTGYVNWNTHDGMTLFLDLNHEKSGAPVTQFSEYATKRFMFGREGNWDDIDMKMTQTPKGRNYEWSIQVNRPIHGGLSVAFDLAVVDKDEDNSYSWLSWGALTQKIASASRCGDLVLADKEMTFAQVKGSIDMSQLISEPTALPVRFEHVEKQTLWLQTRTDSTGNYQIKLPLGQYQVYVPKEMQQVGNEFFQLAKSAPVLTTVKEENDDLEQIIARQIPPPHLSGAQGILLNYSTETSIKVDRFIETYREYYEIPGVSLALIKDGQVAYHKTYGVKSTKTNDPVDEKTLFEAASITKPVFGFLVLRLAERGIIDLDAPLYETLPFEDLEVTPEYKKMTARHVLIHQSGLPNWGVPLLHPPGTRYGYSGEGFEYLKRVVCKITGKDIEELLREEVIDPLDLYHMKFKDSEALREVAAIGHQGSNPTYWPIPSEPGMAHSMHTEARAFSKFAIALLEKKGLKPSTYEEMVEIHTESPSEWWNDPTFSEGAGLGIHVRKSPNGNVIGHGGNNGDFKCLFEVFQDLDMGYVVFTNSSRGDELCRDLAAFLVEGASTSE